MTDPQEPTSPTSPTPRARPVEVDLDEHLPAIAAGDPDAFGRWLAGAERPLRLALRGVAPRLDAEALLQESLLRVWQVAPRVQPDGRPNALLRLAHRICRNLSIDELRRARVEPTELPRLERAMAAAAEGLSPGEPDPLLRDVIARCRQELGGKPAVALEARIASGGGEDDAALAERTGMRKNTFLQNVVRARRFLADCLKKRGVDLASLGATAPGGVR